MKNIIEWALMGILVMWSIAVTAQKPKVQVSFQLVKGTPFYQKYTSDTTKIKQDGLKILKDSLNQYLPFIDFTTEAAPIKLEIKIDQKIAQGSDVIKEYYWLLNFISPSGQHITDQWLFLTPAKFIALQPGASNALTAIKQSWSDHLKTNYNLVLVHNMFSEIPTVIPNEQYYYTSGIRKELILPYTKKDIKLYSDGTEFTVKVIVMEGSSSTEKTLDRARYAGDVDPSMNKPQTLSGCIRIGLNEIAVNRFTSGAVYFTKYTRDLTNRTTTPGSFIDNSQRP